MIKPPELWCREWQRISIIGLTLKLSNAGISQFEGNMRDILDMAKEKNVTCYSSNIRLQILKTNSRASWLKTQIILELIKFVNKAKAELKKGNIKWRISNCFRFAKDLDAFKNFRPSEKLNQSITFTRQRYISAASKILIRHFVNKQRIEL